MEWSLTPNFFFFSFMRLVGQEKCLLVVRDISGTLSVFLEDILSLGNALNASRSKRQLVAEKVGPAPLIAFDEAQRLLVIYVYVNVCMFIAHCHLPD